MGLSGRPETKSEACAARLLFEDESDSGNQINFPLGLVYLPAARESCGIMITIIHI